MKKINTFLVAMLVAFFVVPITAQAATLSDVAGHKNATAIDYLLENSIVEGYEDATYKPDASINRAEFTKIIIEATYDSATIENCLNDNLQPNWTYTFFPDVDRNEWFAKYVCVAKVNDIVNGYEDGFFRPENQINKAESIKILVTSQGYTVPESVSGNTYSDVRPDDWFAPYVKAAFDANLIEDTGSSALNAGEALTRGGMSEMTYRAMVSEGEKFIETTNNQSSEGANESSSQNSLSSDNSAETTSETTHTESDTANCKATDWTCTAFSPIECPSSGQKTRTCTLSNSACLNASAVKPSTSLSCEPASTATITPTITPTLKSKADSVSSRILVAGSSNNLVANYRFEAEHENWTVQKLAIVNDMEGDFGDQISSNSAVTSITIAYLDSSGQKQNKTVAMVNGEARFTGLNLFVPASSSTNLEVHANINSISAFGDSLSGQVIRLGLRNVSNTESTFEAVSQTSATRNNFVSTSDVTTSSGIKSFVVRKTVPTIASIDLPGVKLSNGDEKELYSFSVNANSNGSVSLGRIMFNVDIYEDSGNDVKLSKFGLWRGGTKLSSVTIRDASQNDLSGSANLVGDKVLVAFNTEEVILGGSTAIYTLKATISGVEAADYEDFIRTRLYWGDEGTQVSGKTTNTTSNTARLYSVNSADGLFLSQTDFMTSFNSDRNFIWSDISATVHSYGTATNGSSSYDWTNGYLIELADLAYHELLK